MVEKYSEIHLREEKVKKVKEKIYKEINVCSSRACKRLRSLMNKRINYNDKNFEEITEELYILMCLRKFIQLELTFMQVTMVHEERDIIAYVVDSREFDIWLQDNFNFTQHFLFRCKELYCTCDFISLLREDYFAYNFTGIMESVLYHERLKMKNK